MKLRTAGETMEVKSHLILDQKLIKCRQKFHLEIERSLL